MLNNVTFNFYTEKWDDRDAKINLKRLLKEYLKTIVNNVDDMSKLCFEYDDGWTINIEDSKSKDCLLRSLMKLTPEKIHIKEQDQLEIEYED